MSRNKLDQALRAFHRLEPGEQQRFLSMVQSGNAIQSATKFAYLQGQRDAIQNTMQDITQEVIPKSEAFLVAREELKAVIGRIDETVQQRRAYSKPEALTERLKILSEELSRYGKRFENTGDEVIKLLPGLVSVDNQIQVWKETASIILDDIKAILRGRKGEDESIEAIKTLAGRYAKLPANEQYASVLSDVLKRKSTGPEDSTKEIVLHIHNQLTEATDKGRELSIIEAAELAVDQLGYQTSPESAKAYYYRYRDQIASWLL